MSLNLVGALISSALYLAMVFVAGIVTANPVAWRTAVAAAGFTYLSHVAQFTAFQSKSLVWHGTGNMLVWASIALGALAGLALLV